jgi:Flp pilus assembly pilin Flp
MSRLIRAFHSDESGQDLIEYVLVAAGVAIGSLAAMQGIATQVQTQIENLSTALAKL